MPTTSAGPHVFILRLRRETGRWRIQVVHVPSGESASLAGLFELDAFVVAHTPGFPASMLSRTVLPMRQRDV